MSSELAFNNVGWYSLFCALVGGYRKPCQEQYWAALRNSQSASYVPKCRRDGDFEQLQCDGQDCWCVETQGREINGTRKRGIVTCPSCEFYIININWKTSYVCQQVTLVLLRQTGVQTYLKNLMRGHGNLQYLSFLAQCITRVHNIPGQI